MSAPDAAATADGAAGVRTVGIVGLGLIGGSLARDLAARGVRVLAHDRDPDTIRVALEAGVLAGALGPDLERAAEADVLVVAVPVSAAPAALAAIARRTGARTIVTDVCSTKQTVGRAAERLGIARRFVGAHPLAGDHRAGWAASRVALFAHAPVYLCPTPATDPAAVAVVQRLWQAVGATPQRLAPEEHDRLLAWTSHLPQVTASALARALHRAGVPLDRLGPGGRDMTRLAASSPDVWVPIALDNAEPLARAVEGLERALAALRDGLVRGDHEAVRRFFDVTATGDG